MCKSKESPRRPLNGLWILILHLPLLGYAFWLYPELQPAQSITQLPAVHLIGLLTTLLLPYLLLPRLAPGWNPTRARLGEPED